MQYVSGLFSPFKNSRLFGSSKKASGTPKAQKREEEQLLKSEKQQKQQQHTLLNFSPEELPSLPWDQQESTKNTLIQSSRSADAPLKRQSIRRHSSDAAKSMRERRRQSREKPASLNLTEKIEREYIEVSDEKDHTPLTTPQERSRPSSSEFYSSQNGHSISQKNDDSVVPRTPPQEKRSSSSFVYATELKQTIYKSTVPQSTADYSSRRNNTNENFDAFEREARSSSTSSASADGANREFMKTASLSAPRRPPVQRRPLSDSLTGRTKMLTSSRRSSDSVLLSGVNLPPARYEHREMKRMSLHEYHKYQQEMVVVQLKKNQEKASKRALANKKLAEMNTSRPMGPTLIQMQQEYKEQLTSMVGIQNKPVSKRHGFADGPKSNVVYKRHSAVEYGTTRRALDGSAGMENRKRSHTVDGAMHTATDKRKSYDASPSASTNSSYSKRLGAKLMDETGDTRPNITANTFVPPPSSKYHPGLQAQSLPSRYMSKQMHSIIEEQHHPYLHGKSCSDSLLQKRAFPQPERHSPMFSPSFQHSASSLSSSSTNHSSSSGSRTAARKSTLSNAYSSGSRPLSAYYGTGVQTEKKSRRKSTLK
ncbi:4636_t:CDS:2 [Paraglomus occultum]|uniref:4636_t:CDS:1 n=1 Tax=Paraglomus occultum TaxID=144539 RepID=A0A9N9AZ92_9GLOM|nr:4636_t:CDS:2 [Paraglomus occultum]